MPPDPDDLLAIFDHDGVLVDSFDLHERPGWSWSGGRPGPHARVHPRDVRHDEPQHLPPTLGERLTEDEVRRYADLKEECYRDVARGRIRLMDGMRELLDALTDRGVKLAIGSSGPLPTSS